MTEQQEDERLSELNDLVDAYEAARTRDDTVDLRECLPNPLHPLFREARRELVRIDLEYSWQGGNPKRLAEYIALFPDLLDDEESAQEITFEEYRLRCLGGETPSATEYERQYGVTTTTWPGNDADLDDYPKTICTPGGTVHAESQDTARQRINTPPLEWDMLHEALSSRRTDEPAVSPFSATAKVHVKPFDAPADSGPGLLFSQVLTSLPEVGTRFLNFKLIAELGRGGFGRVYLARQCGLANRLVALKITVDLQGEEQKLAQLQHTNVVPIYSAHKAGALYAVCMPYFGPTTLADVIRRCRELGALPDTGACLVETMRSRVAAFRTHSAPTSDGTAGVVAPPTLRMLEESTYVNAILWLAERVTEGLIHAHEHGILHGDLKPANILLTDDGQPMLLDFNLATDVKGRAALGELRVGGTLPYMAPEFLAALQGGDKRQIDARSDIYGLGVILFQLLTGQIPYETQRGPLVEVLPEMIAARRQTPPRLRPLNRAISPAVESIVRHCLDPDPSKRYQSAQQLHEDLQRHRQNLPLRNAAEPSWRERAQKWVRRHPRLTAPNTVVIAGLMLIAAVLSFQAWQTLTQTEKNLVKTAKDLVKTEKNLIDANANAENERKNREAAQLKAQAAEVMVHFRKFDERALKSSRELMDCVTLLRLRPEIWPIKQAQLHELAVGCRELLAGYDILSESDWQINPRVALLPEVEKQKLREDMRSLLHTLGGAELFNAGRLSDDWNELTSIAATVTSTPLGFSPGSVMDALQAAHRSTSARCLAIANQLPAREGSEAAYWTAAALAVKGQMKDAKPILLRATREFPDHFGVWRLLALCHQSAGEYREAEACWNTCRALNPNDSWVRYCHGAVSLDLCKWNDAQKDFDAFLKMHPSYREAYVRRAVALEGQKEYMLAIDDYTEALRLGPPAPELYLRRVELKEESGRTKEAELDRISVLNTKPTDLEGWILRGLIQEKQDPKAALADLDRALEIEPYNAVALFHKATILADHTTRSTEAIGALNRLLIVHPEHVEARLKRGLLFAKRGVYSKAIADAKRGLESGVTPARNYQAACIYARTSQEHRPDAKRAIELLASALRNGYGLDRFETDKNLVPLHIVPEFQSLKAAAPYLGPVAPK